MEMHENYMDKQQQRKKESKSWTSLCILHTPSSSRFSLGDIGKELEWKEFSIDPNTAAMEGKTADFYMIEN